MRDREAGAAVELGLARQELAPLSPLERRHVRPESRSAGRGRASGLPAVEPPQRLDLLALGRRQAARQLDRAGPRELDEHLARPGARRDDRDPAHPGRHDELSRGHRAPPEQMVRLLARRPRAQSRADGVEGEQRHRADHRLPAEALRAHNRLRVRLHREPPAGARATARRAPRSP